MSEQPLVSISIITYNQVNFIREAMNSALNQDYENLEVVVADDDSTDGTAAVIQEYAKQYPKRLIPVLGDCNLGITGNSNRALRACNGKYIAFQGGDDYFLPGKITAQVEYMEANDSCVISYHNVEVFESASGKIIRKWNDLFKVREGGAREVVLYGTFMPATSVMINRDMCPDVWFNHRIPIMSDWLFWVEVLATSGERIDYINKILARHRRHGGNITSTREYVIDEFNRTLEIVEEKYPELRPACKKKRSEGYLMRAVAELKEGRIGGMLVSIMYLFSPKYYFGTRSIEIMVKKILGMKK